MSIKVGVLIIRRKLDIRKTEFNVLLSVIKCTNDDFVIRITELHIHDSRTTAAACRKA